MGDDLEISEKLSKAKERMYQYAQEPKKVIKCLYRLFDENMNFVFETLDKDEAYKWRDEGEYETWISYTGSEEKSPLRWVFPEYRRVMPDS